jgi:hypothetical protein
VGLGLRLVMVELMNEVSVIGFDGKVDLEANPEVGKLGTLVMSICFASL